MDILSRGIRDVEVATGADSGLVKQSEKIRNERRNFKMMIMDLAKGDYVQYTCIMRGSIADFLTAFEHYMDSVRRAKKEAEKLRAGQKKWHR